MISKLWVHNLIDENWSTFCFSSDVIHSSLITSSYIVFVLFEYFENRYCWRVLWILLPLRWIICAGTHWRTPYFTLISWRPLFREFSIQLISNSCRPMHIMHSGFERVLLIHFAAVGEGCMIVLTILNHWHSPFVLLFPLVAVSVRSSGWESNATSSNNLNLLVFCFTSLVLLLVVYDTFVPTESSFTDNTPVLASVPKSD